ncbi:gamma-glutamyl-gamma-aminobutyrate hydrolase family protein [Lachnospiraceae bacterium]|nr:gamma-glutamyl-gamma-aminobutyrate hydrolase family protein [Lachnospiraceae bacterium]
MFQNLFYSHSLKIAIVGRSKDTINYEKALQEMGVSYSVTMDSGLLSDFHGLLLPGGGDITPAFFGQQNHGSKNIDTELDIVQLQALEFFVKRKKPVLGICKGMQLINVFFGGNILQHIPESPRHAWDGHDKIHATSVQPCSFLARLYGCQMITNSAHHQSIGQLGRELHIIQRSDDGIPEGIAHTSLPILGVQWHPERQFANSRFSHFQDTCTTPSANEPADGKILFSYFLSLLSIQPVRSVP